MVLFSMPKSLCYQMFPEVFQHLLNQNLVESSNLEPPIFDPSWSMKIFTIFGSHILHFSTVIWERFEKVLNYSYFQRFSSHFTHKTILEFINTLYGVDVRSLRPNVKVGEGVANSSNFQNFNCFRIRTATWY